jgi:dihydrofolate synthase/folylpolyglutamate synthase
MIKYIHTAGTNGKGSTCSYIAHGLISAGYKTGKFMSPHVLDISERITVNDVPIANLPELPKTGWFQALWGIALSYFAEQAVDYAVIETGIGGLHDCTNAITPVLSVITKIGYDHMELLGNTIEEIATHKAGIIKAGVPAVTDPTQFEGAMRVLRETAARKGSRLYVPAESSGNPFECNRIVAREALRVLGIPCPDLSQVHLPGRIQVLSHNPLTIADGAHNVDAIRAIMGLYPQNKVIVFGMQKSKDYDSCLKLLAGHEVIAVENVECEAEVKTALEQARKSNKMILVTGSLYLAGTALRLHQP